MDMDNVIIPWYTENAVSGAAIFVESADVPELAKKYINAAIRWVQRVLRKEEIPHPCGDMADGKLFCRAAEIAAEKREAAVVGGDFIAAMRWRYIESALSDYMDYLKGVRRK